MVYVGTLELFVPAELLWVLPAVLLPVPPLTVATGLDVVVLPEQMVGGIVLAMLLPAIVVHEPETRFLGLLVVDDVLGELSKIHEEKIGLTKE